MRITTKTSGIKHRVWEVIYSQAYDNVLTVDFIDTETAEVITINYDTIEQKINWVPPFNPNTTKIYADDVYVMNLGEFVSKLSSLIKIRKIINAGVSNDYEYLKAGWNLDRPLTDDDYIEIVVDKYNYNDIIGIGIDTIIVAIETKHFNYKNLTPEQFIQVCEFWTIGRNPDNVPF